MRRGWLLGVGLGCLGSFALLATEPSPPAFKLAVEEDGVYQLRFEQLVEAGWTGGPFKAARLGLTLGGEPVPVRLLGADDGAFGPGDRLEFIGRHPRGAISYFDPDLTANVYRLHTAAKDPAHMVALPPPAADAAPVALLAEHHLERDDLQLRFSRLRNQEPETWYWARATSSDAEPLSMGLDLSALDRDAALPVRLKVALRGWSWQRAQERESPDHVVELAWNGLVLGQLEWTGQEEAIFEAPAVPAAALTGEQHRLSLKVLPRSRKDGSAILDVVVLNWIEVGFAHRGEIHGEEPTWLAPATPGGVVVLRSERPVALYGEAGAYAQAKVAASGSQRFAAPAGGFLVLAGEPRVVPEVRLDRPSRLVEAARQADYLMIAHGSLLAAVEPLANFHRRRGLTVELIDVEDIYDEFSEGLPRAAAIRAFVSHAYHHWARPAPRFVLLVGDASWDPRAGQQGGGERTYVDWAYGPRDGLKFRRNQSTTYTAGSRVDRNLVPTGSYITTQGHAATDNYFVTVDGTDHFPDLAIGRFPVVAPEEVTAIVDKTIRYLSSPEPGAWRTRMLWITNEDVTLQSHSDAMARQLVGRGYSARRLYPQANGEANALHQAALRQALDEGFSLVHFHGHGGRYIWRTATPDYQKNADLFTLDDLDKLAPQTRLPVVLSMTCYSAPFDHPTADSIGEKFLRLAGKGAVAVYAASWRNSPLVGYSQAVVEEILAAETLGEGLMRAKKRAVIVPLIEQYNLLGDPALTLVRVDSGLTLTATAKRGEAIEGVFAEPTEAKVEVEWLSELGEVLASQQVRSSRVGFSATLTAEDVARVAFRGGARAVVARSLSGDGRERVGVLDLAPPAAAAGVGSRAEAASLNPEKAGEPGGAPTPDEADEGG